MKYRKLYQLGIVVIFIALFGVTLLLLDISKNAPIEKQNLTTKNSYPVNENGQTYGPNYGDHSIEDPDLIAAIGIDGTNGYVLASDLISTPSTPVEAIEQQKNRKSPIFIHLYDKDGRTVVGKFQVGD